MKCTTVIFGVENVNISATFGAVNFPFYDGNGSSGGSRISRGGGGGGGGGRGPPTWALFGENVCENERIGSHRGACAGHAPPRSANGFTQ